MGNPDPTLAKPQIVMGPVAAVGDRGHNSVLSPIRHAHGPEQARGAQSSVLGIGIDIVETERIEQSLEKFGDRFLKRVFHRDEIAYAKSMKFPALHLAARFSAKEAISKAFGTGIGRQLGWTDMEIRRKDTGEPYVVLHGKGAELARRRGVAQVLVSLSHCKAYSAANAILLGDCRAGMPEGLPATGDRRETPLASRPATNLQSAP